MLLYSLTAGKSEGGGPVGIPEKSGGGPLGMPLGGGGKSLSWRRAIFAAAEGAGGISKPEGGGPVGAGPEGGGPEGTPEKSGGGGRELLSWRAATSKGAAAAEAARTATAVKNFILKKKKWRYMRISTVRKECRAAKLA